MASNRLSVLKKSAEFNSLKQSGHRLRYSDWLVINIKPNETGLRCGWTISKKVSNAVVRNKLKRWCREFFRSDKVKASGYKCDINVIFKPKSESFYKGLEFKHLKAGLDVLLEKFKQER